MRLASSVSCALMADRNRTRHRICASQAASKSSIRSLASPPFFTLNRHRFDMQSEQERDRGKARHRRVSLSWTNQPALAAPAPASDRPSLGREGCTESPAQRRREVLRSEEHTSALQSLKRISYAVY